MNRVQPGIEANLNKWRFVFYAIGILNLDDSDKSSTLYSSDYWKRYAFWTGANLLQIYFIYTETVDWYACLEKQINEFLSPKLKIRQNNQFSDALRSLLSPACLYLCIYSTEPAILTGSPRVIIDWFIHLVSRSIWQGWLSSPKLMADPVSWAERDRWRSTLMTTDQFLLTAKRYWMV